MSGVLCPFTGGYCPTDDIQIDFSACDNVNSAFTTLLTVFRIAVNTLSIDGFHAIKGACVTVAPKDEPFYSSLKNASDGRCLFDVFSENHTYLNWIYLSFLDIIANCYKVYVNDSLMNLIEAYKKVVFSKSLREVLKSLPHEPVKDKVDKFYTEIQQRLDDKNLDNMTIQELLKSEPSLTRKIGLLLSVIRESCLIISWLIPTDEVYQAYLSFLTIPHQSRKDNFIRFRNWVAHPPEYVLQEEQKKFGQF